MRPTANFVRIALPHHLGHGDLREDRGGGDRDAGDRGEHGVRRDGRDAEPAVDPAEDALRGAERVAADVRYVDEQAHQHEQRHGREHVLGDRAVRRERERPRRDQDVVLDRARGRRTPVSNSANAIGKPSTISTTTSTIIAMPTVRGSTSALQSAATSSAPSAKAATANQRRGSAAARACPACTTSWRASSMLATAQPTTISSLIGQTVDREDAFDAGELVRVPGARRNPASCRARCVSRMPIPSNGEQHVPHARRDGVAPRERLEEHLDAHEPAVQHGVRELQEHARDERQRHHLGDARDRVVEQRCAP